MSPPEAPDTTDLQQLPKLPHPKSISTPPKNQSVLARFLIPVLFLIASGALVFGVFTALNKQEEKKPRINTSLPVEPTEPVPEATVPVVPAPLIPESVVPELSGEPEVPSLPTPPSEVPLLTEPATKLPGRVAPRISRNEPLDVLEKFLSAKSLAERLPLIETKIPKAELTASCLARPLLPTAKILIDFQDPVPLEDRVDYYYRVDFEDGGQRTIPQTILVRTRGRDAPKVVVDPFLDLYGGRLAAYALQPSEKAGVFQVIISAMATCADPAVPNYEEKMTLKLLARDNTKKIAEAYFGKLSKIGEMLEDGSYRLSYGKAKACTVELRWNSEEDADHPYLEAVEIKALGWNL